MALPLLAMEKSQIVGENPFDNDLLNRKELAQKFTGYIERLRMGAVLAIDAPWGDGKTWFGKNWAKQLEYDGYSVAYIDAFEQDYMDDPFILLTSELLNIVKDKSQSKMKLTKKATNVVKTTASISAKIGMGLITKYVLAGVDLGDEIEGAINEASKETANKSSKWIEESFKKYSENKKSIVEFKEELEKYATSQDKPIIIFIDELDRCKPDFSVSLIERIKHFFDVPNVIFILLLNREQLEKSIKGVYGIETDASAYLGKFINFFFTLPKVNSVDISHHRIRNFIHTTITKYKFSNNTTSIISNLELFTFQFNLSLRDIEKAIALYAFASEYNIDDGAEHLLYYIIVLKLKEPKLFKRMVASDIEAHKEMKDKLDKLIQRTKIQDRSADDMILNIFYEWHDTYVNGDFKNPEREITKTFELFYYPQPQDIFPFLAQKIDLSI